MDRGDNACQKAARLLAEANRLKVKGRIQSPCRSSGLLPGQRDRRQTLAENFGCRLGVSEERCPQRPLPERTTPPTVKRTAKCVVYPTVRVVIVLSSAAWKLCYAETGWDCRGALTTFSQIVSAGRRGARAARKNFLARGVEWNDFHASWSFFATIRARYVSRLAFRPQIGYYAR